MVQVLLVITIAVSLCSCKKSPDSSFKSTPENAQPASISAEKGSPQEKQAAKTRQFETVTHHSVNLPEHPHRVISLAPNITEAIFFLHHEKALVGVTKFCNYPPEAEKIDKIGGFIDADMERIVALRPDLIIGTTTSLTLKQIPTFEAQHIPYAYLDIGTIETSLKGLTDLETLLNGAPDSAVALRIDNLSKELDSLEGRLNKEIRFAFVVSRKPLMLAGAEAFPSELLTKAGAENVAANLEGDYPQVDLEVFVSLNPNLIIDTSPQNGEKAPWEAFPTLKAVQQKRVILPHDDGLVRPGPRLGGAYSNLVDEILRLNKEP